MRVACSSSRRAGSIKILDLATGQVLPTPFLNVSSEILADADRGLLGLAFDPDYASNGFFYVNLTNTSGVTEIRRYHAAPNANVADAASAAPVLSIDLTPGHKAGWLGFGPDGDLYIRDRRRRHHTRQRAGPRQPARQDFAHRRAR